MVNVKYRQGNKLDLSSAPKIQSGPAGIGQDTGLPTALLRQGLRPSSPGAPGSWVHRFRLGLGSAIKGCPPKTSTMSIRELSALILNASQMARKFHRRKSVTDRHDRQTLIDRHVKFTLKENNKT